MTAPALARPRPPALDRDTAFRLAATEYERFLAVLRDLDPADWSRPTECPAWDVRAMAAP
ncbi:MAG: maleylpyruvate isomerase N-terminal domain-containing protein, partial [Actinomycetes bacterium]